MKYLIFLLLAGCSNNLPIYKERIANICIEHNCRREAWIRRYTVEFDIMNNGVAATCGNNEILIDIKYWHELDELEKEALLMHEYGHCVFGKDDIHDVTQIDIMVQRFRFMKEKYRKHREYMLEKFFGDLI